MSKKTYIIANWKMQLTNKEAADLANSLKHESIKTLKQNIELILCPSFAALSAVAEAIKKSEIKLGAQNVFYHEKGAYTGETSPSQLKELGVDYVIIGHSERRQYQKETNEEINQKIKVCLANDLTPILCVGETFEERQIGKTDLILIQQITKALQDVKLNNNQNLIIAYEPVWVIGSGQAVEPKEAQHASAVIRGLLPEFFSHEIIKNNISIIYGGSVDESNVMDFIKPGVIDGALVGGASLKAEKFLSLIRAVETE
ncbi:MAG: triose-phosphate isomerase [Patescibacteria group bacterium]|nr:triose-phosphate isomerase [Patescibacteria group bacterium]